MLLSFMSESRRLDNHRLKRELGVALHFSTVESGLKPAAAAPRRQGSSTSRSG